MIESDGTVTSKKVTDPSLIGEHELTLAAFLKEKDPSGTILYPLKLSLKLETKEQITHGVKDLIAEMAGSLERRNPVSVKPIAPVYYAVPGKTEQYVFEFADPLALELSENGVGPIFDISPGELAITIQKNELPTFVAKESVDYQAGIGFG